jgi:O-antigen/teichoic acid export membrane protein
MISIGAVLLLSGFGSLSAILTVVAIGVGLTARSRVLDVAWLASQIWKSSRWLAPAAVVSWLITWGIFPIVAAFSGAATAGVLRALQNLLTPIVQFNSALNLAILPRVADKFADYGDAYACRFTLRGTVIFTAVVSAYCGVILAAAPALLPMIYKKPEITLSAFLLWPLSLAIIFEGARIASSMSLLAMRRTRIVLVARLVALVAFAGSGAVLAHYMNYVGILWANVLGTAVGTAIVIGAALRRSDPKPLP